MTDTATGEPERGASSVVSLACAPARDPAEPDPEPLDDAARLAQLRPWQRAFIMQLREVPNITLAARAANFTPQGCRKWRDKCEMFRELWDEALEGCVDEVEGALFTEAAVGRERVVYGKDGEVKSTERVRDVNAMRFYLAGNRPGKYREVKDGGGQPQQFEPAEAAVIKALAGGVLSEIGRKLVERHGKTIEAETLPPE